MTTVAELLASGRLELVPADRAAAALRLSRAGQHLETAASLIGQDNEVACGSLHDAARQRMRRQRDKSEYADLFFGAQDVVTDLRAEEHRGRRARRALTT